jgi:hypothetical protein
MMMGATRALFVSGVIVGCTACATMTANECAVADWRALGVLDGQRGASMEHFNRRQQACARNAIAVDFDAYRIGRTEGLRNYCQPQNGFRVGMNSLLGPPPNADCPADLASDFRTAAADGARAGQALRRSQAADMQLNTAHARLDEIERLLPGYEHQATSAVTIAERQSARESVLSLREERVRLREAIPGYEQTAATLSKDLLDARESMGGRYGAW